MNTYGLIEQAPSSKKMTGLSITTLGAAAIFALIAASPGLESAQDAIVYDAIITQTCFDRHGFNFVGRWSCRSSLRQVGPMAFALTCAFGKEKSDICKAADKIKAQQDAAKKASQ